MCAAGCQSTSEYTKGLSNWSNCFAESDIIQIVDTLRGAVSRFSLKNEKASVILNKQ